jgi:acyl phosphate:glycerol-3-phosphate acyltransferase
MEKYLFVLLAYLLGSIPFSYLFGKIFRGIDLRKHGSGNLGGTNAIRVLGKPIGFTVAVLDVVKAGLLVFLILNTDWFDGMDLFHPLVYGFASVIGHIHPLWFKFKGGKGVATTLGLLMAYMPFFAIAMILLFFLVEYFTRIVSVSSTVAVISAFFFSLAMHLSRQPDWALVIVTFLSSIVVVYAHRSNYQRLRKGTESRVKFFDKWDVWFGRNDPK